jgi:hypothetical protein
MFCKSKTADELEGKWAVSSTSSSEGGRAAFYDDGYAVYSYSQIDSGYSFSSNYDNANKTVNVNSLFSGISISAGGAVSVTPISTSGNDGVYVAPEMKYNDYIGYVIVVSYDNATLYRLFESGFEVDYADGGYIFSAYKVAVTYSFDTSNRLKLSTYPDILWNKN